MRRSARSVVYPVARNEPDTSTITPVGSARPSHTKLPANSPSSATSIVTEHSPSIDRNDTIPSGVCAAIVSDSEGAVGRLPTKLVPPMPTVVASVPPAVHTTAIPPGAGAKTPEMRFAIVVSTSMSPESWKLTSPAERLPVEVGMPPVGPVAGPVAGDVGAPVAPVGGNAEEGIGVLGPMSSLHEATSATSAMSEPTTIRVVRMAPPGCARPYHACSCQTGPKGVRRGAVSIGRMLDRDLAEEVLRAARARGGSFAELFVEERAGISVRLDDGKIEELTTGVDRGAGVRVGIGTSFGYAYSNRLDRAALLDAAAAAAAALEERAPGRVVDLRSLEPPVVHEAVRDASSVPAADKVAWAREADDAARALGADIRQVTAVYGDSVQRMLVAASDGRWAEEVRPRVRLSVTVVAARDGVVQTGFHGPAGLAGVEFLESHPPAETAGVAARRAVTMLGAQPAPAGETTVVLAPGMGGVLFHEAVGHPLEADIVDKEASVYRGRVGELLASPILNGVDDATVPNAWGSFSFDDEGTPAQRTVLFEEGVLRGWLYDRLRAEKEGVPSTGNGRRQSYAHAPIPRMSNTYILNGGSAPEDIVSSTERGVYVAALAGGQTNPASGDFVFGCSEAYRIEGGELTTPVRGANLIGRAIDVMSNVDAIGDDFDIWPGVCGKDGQGVPVGSGSPTLRISRITVGGTGG